MGGIELERSDGEAEVGSQAVHPSPMHLLWELLPTSGPVRVREKEALRCVLIGAVGLVCLKQREDTTRFAMIRPSFPGRVVNVCTVATEGRIIPRWEAWPVCRRVFNILDLYPLHTHWVPLALTQL